MKKSFLCASFALCICSSIYAADSALDALAKKAGGVVGSAMGSAIAGAAQGFAGEAKGLGNTAASTAGSLRNNAKNFTNNASSVSGDSRIESKTDLNSVTASGGSSVSIGNISIVGGANLESARIKSEVTSSGEIKVDGAGTTANIGTVGINGANVKDSTISTKVNVKNATVTGNGSNLSMGMMNIGDGAIVENSTITSDVDVRSVTVKDGSSLTVGGVSVQ